MNKTEETNSLIEYVTKLTENDIKVENIVFLADIAKSLAIIADKVESGDIRDTHETDN